MPVLAPASSGPRKRSAGLEVASCSRRLRLSSGVRTRRRLRAVQWGELPTMVVRVVLGWCGVSLLVAGVWILTITTVRPGPRRRDRCIRLHAAWLCLPLASVRDRMSAPSKGNAKLAATGSDSTARHRQAHLAARDVHRAGSRSSPLRRLNSESGCAGPGFVEWRVSFER